jgi:hypothetical protein
MERSVLSIPKAHPVILGDGCEIGSVRAQSRSPYRRIASREREIVRATVSNQVEPSWFTCRQHPIVVQQKDRAAGGSGDSAIVVGGEPRTGESVSGVFATGLQAVAGAAFIP